MYLHNICMYILKGQTTSGVGGKSKKKTTRASTNCYTNVWVQLVLCLPRLLSCTSMNQTGRQKHSIWAFSCRFCRLESECQTPQTDVVAHVSIRQHRKHIQQYGTHICRHLDVYFAVSNRNVKCLRLLQQYKTLYETLMQQQRHIYSMGHIYIYEYSQFYGYCTHSLTHSRAQSLSLSSLSLSLSLTHTRVVPNLSTNHPNRRNPWPVNHKKN